MSWIQTRYTGRVDVLDPQPEQIDIRDIAFALSNVCRFGGHCYPYYSVAEHCVRVAAQVVGYEYTLALQALLHDASEAYLGDMVRPLKEQMPEFRAVEKNMERVILGRFNLPTELHPLIKEIDMMMLAVERQKLLPMCPHEWEWLKGVEPVVLNEPLGWSRQTAERKFLLAYEKYSPA